MKPRTFIIGLTVTIIALLLICLSLWKASTFKSPLNLKDEAMKMPQAAKFIPKENYLAIHLKLDPSMIPQYIEAAAPQKSRKLAKKGGTKLRDGIFALLGLNFDKDLSNKIDSRISFAIFKPLNKSDPIHWVLVLKNKEGNDKNLLLKDFWERKKLSGIAIEEEINDGVRIVSGKREQLGKYKEEIASANSEDSYLIIASDITTLKESLSISKHNDESQFSDQEIIYLINKLGKGISLVTLSNDALESWFNVPKSITQRDDLSKFAGSIKFDHSDLLLNGIFMFNDEVIFIKDKEVNNIVNKLNLNNQLEDIAIISEPSSILNKNNHDPIAEIMEPLISKYIKNMSFYNARRIGEIENEALVFGRYQDQWIIGTNKNDQLDNINESMRKNNFIKDKLIVKEKNIDIWSRVKANEINGVDQIIKEIGFILDEDENINWWSNKLELLEKRKELISLSPKKNQWDSFNDSSKEDLSQRISLGKSSSQSQIEQWKPWILLEKVIGNSLEDNIKNLSIGIGSNKDENNSELNLIAKLSLN